jgi:hypothetical protein
MQENTAYKNIQYTFKNIQYTFKKYNYSGSKVPESGLYFYIISNLVFVNSLRFRYKKFKP